MTGVQTCALPIFGFMEFSLEVSFMIEGENIFLIVPRYGPQIPSLSMKSESKIVEETTRCLALA